MGEATDHLDVDSIAGVSLTFCIPVGDEKETVVEDNEDYFDMLGRKQLQGFMYGGGSQTTDDTPSSSLPPSQKFLLSRERVDEFGGIITDRPTYIALRPSTIQPFDKDDAQFAKRLFKLSHSTSSNDGKRNSNEDEAMQTTEGKTSSLHKQPYMTLLPLDSEVYYATNHGGIDCDQQTSSEAGGAAGPTAEASHQLSAEEQQQQPTTRQQTENPPTASMKFRTKLRTLSKALSRMKKACCVAIAA